MLKFISQVCSTIYAFHKCTNSSSFVHHLNLGHRVNFPWPRMPCSVWFSLTSMNLVQQSSNIAILSREKVASLSFEKLFHNIYNLIIVPKVATTSVRSKLRKQDEIKSREKREWVANQINSWLLHLLQLKQCERASYPRALSFLLRFDLVASFNYLKSGPLYCLLIAVFFLFQVVYYDYAFRIPTKHKPFPCLHYLLA